MLYLESAYNWVYVLITIAICITMIFFAFNCTCCEKTVQKDGLIGIDGLVKINLDESQTPTANENNLFNRNPSLKTKDKFRNGISNTNSNRSLPAIPADTLDSNIITVDDTCSEIYATVEEDKKNLNSMAEGPLGRWPFAEEEINSINIPNNISLENEVSEHPYDKLKKEHPYASLHKHNERSSIGESNSSKHIATTSVEVSSIHISTNSIEQNNILMSSEESTGIVIEAAIAVAGGITASQELPYMTPPSPLPVADVHPDVQPIQPVQHFSGDSQDSGKGYTSISVREPLANILNATRKTKNLLNDAHYATVSDDSDEMYAAIEDNQNIYTNGSDTYAQIHSPVDSNAINNTSAINDEIPQPPSVDSLRQVAQVHSRQASSSSCTSSVAAAQMSSPKLDKRPIPHSSPLPSTSRNLDDMYAKINKKRKKDEDIKPVLKQMDTDSDGYYETLINSTPPSENDPNYEVLRPNS